MGGSPSLPELDPTKISLSLRGRELDSIPYDIPPDHQIESIDVSYNKIENLPKGLQSLQNLDISFNEWQYISNKIESSLLTYTCLSELKLSGNNIKSIPKSLARMGSLQVLSLSQNKIKSFDISLPNLTSLDLSCNKLEEFKMVSPQLTNLNLNFNFLKVIDFSSETLSHLNATGNNITDINKNCKFPSAHWINLSHNRISKLPSIETIFPHVSHFSVSFNLLQSMPPNLPQTLTALSVSNNYITSLGEELSGLRSLTVLLAQDNFINFIPSLPSSIDTLKLERNRISEFKSLETNGLQSLNVSDNLLKDLPNISRSCIQSFCVQRNSLLEIKVSNLTRSVSRLDLSHCGIKEIPPELFRLPALRYIVLTGNKISEIPGEIQRSSLLSIAISENPILSLPSLPPTLAMILAVRCEFVEFPESIARLPRLSIVDLSHNRLQSLPPLPRAHTIRASCNLIEDIGNLPEGVRQIDLSHNRLAKIDFIEPLESLTDLDLSHNALEDFSDIICPKLRYLNLSHNKEMKCLLKGIDYPSLCSIDIVKTSICLEGFESLEIMSDRPYKEIIKNCVINDYSTENSEHLEKPQNSERIEKEKDESSEDGASDGWVGGCRIFNIDSECEVGYSGMRGNREQMEDAIVIRRLRISGKANSGEEFDAIAVLDGHAGREASSFCAGHLAGALEGMERLTEESVGKAISALNELLRASGAEDGTTLALIIRGVSPAGGRGKRIICANVGDSRAVIVRRDGSAFPLSYDHKPDERSELESIRAAGSFVVDGRTAGVLAIARSLGDFRIRGVSGTPSVCAYEATGDDFRVVIGCDGVFDVVSNSEVGALVAGEGDVARAAALLRNVAFARMSQDNISVVVMDL